MKCPDAQSQSCFEIRKTFKMQQTFGTQETHKSEANSYHHTKYVNVIVLMKSNA